MLQRIKELLSNAPHVPGFYRRMPWGLVTLSILGALVSVGSAAQPSGKDAPLGWNELAPIEKLEDPFTKLTSRQREQLSEVSRMMNLLANDKVSEGAPSVEKAIRTANELRASGIDVGYLLSMRGAVQRMREAQGRVVVKRLDGSNVTLQGFMIPTEVIDGRVKEFLLVPDYDFCSYGVTLPPNQVVLVRSSVGIPVEGAMCSARVIGRLTTESTNRTLLSKSGSRNVEAGYSLIARDVEMQEIPLRGSRGRIVLLVAKTPTVSD